MACILASSSLMERPLLSWKTFLRLGRRHARIADEEAVKPTLGERSSQYDEILQRILHLDDREVDEQRAHLQPYMIPYLHFVLKNLESLQHKAPDLLAVLQTATQPNGVPLVSGVEVNGPSDPGSDAVALTSLERNGKPVKHWPDIWLRLISEVVDALSYEANAQRRGPELNAIRKRLVAQGILKADVDVEQAAQLILRLVGWLTMLFEPPLDYEESGRKSFSPTKDSPKVPQPRLRKANTWTPHPIEVDAYDEKPIIDTLHHMLKGSPFPQPEVASSEPLQSSNLSYYTLSKLAGVRVQWTESLGRHLELNKSNRTLKLFRFPSFCMLMCLGPSDRTFIQSIYKSCEDDEQETHRNTTPLTSRDCLREILYTYTVIFGANELSRHALAQDLRKEIIAFPVNSPDVLLRRLCLTDLLKESSGELNFGDLKLSYSPEDDFPFFGKRLAALQDYTLMQAPNNWTTLWLDRRNPREFYAFWAALVFGVSALVLAFVQVIGMVVQIVAQYQSTGS